MTDDEGVGARPQAADAANAWHRRCVIPWAYSLRPSESATLLDLAFRRAHQDATSVAPSEASPQ